MAGITLSILVLCTLGRGDIEFTKQPRDVTVTSGQSLTLSCELSDPTYRDCRWKKDGQLVKLPQSRLSLGDCNLVFQPVLLTDEAQYMCEASGLVSRMAK